MTGKPPSRRSPQSLGIPYAAGMKPADKIAALQALAAAGHRVAMIGDGLNDAPALAEAHVSLSPISALDITQAQADAVFLGERLAPIVDAFDIGRRARRLMNQNLGFSVVYNLAAVPLAIFGIVTPLIAALAMSGSSIAVTLNALRARPRVRGQESESSAIGPAGPQRRRRHDGAALPGAAGSVSRAGRAVRIPVVAAERPV